MNKEELIIDLIAHPERYSDEQMQEILSDDEALAAYTALLEARMAIDKNSAEKVDIDAAWHNFAAQNADLLEKHRQPETTDTKHYFLMKWRKIAAMFVAAVAVSGLAFAAIHTFTANRMTPKEKVEAVQKANTVADTVADTTCASATNMETSKAKPVFHKTFENVALGDMLQEMAKHYGMTVEFRNQNASSLRYYYEWNSADDVNKVIDELNHSEQVAIAIEGNKIVVE